MDCLNLVVLSDMCSFADNIAIHASDSSLHSLTNRLEHDASIVVEWFEKNLENLIKANVIL